MPTDKLTPGMHDIFCRGRHLQVYVSRIDGAISFVRLAVRTRGDGRPWRMIRADSPLAVAAISEAGRAALAQQEKPNA